MSQHTVKGYSFVKQKNASGVVQAEMGFGLPSETAADQTQKNNSVNCNV